MGWRDRNPSRTTLGPQREAGCGYELLAMTTLLAAVGGMLARAFGYVVLSVVGGLAAGAVGYALGRKLA